MKREPAKFDSRRCPMKCEDGEIVVVRGEWCRWVRQRAGLSLREVARRMKLTAPYISDVELGRRAVTKRMRAFYEGLERR
jgi:predicted transcriptional regulator